jgi:hypothetical protein
MEHKRNRYWGLFLFLLILSASLLTGRALAQVPSVEATWEPLPAGWEVTHQLSDDGTVGSHFLAELHTIKRDPAAPAQPATGGYWVLDNTDIQKKVHNDFVPPVGDSRAAETNGQVEISSGAGTSSSDWEKKWPYPCKGHVESAHAWTPLPATLIPGETISVTFQVSMSGYQDCEGGEGDASFNAATGFYSDWTLGYAGPYVVAETNYWHTSDPPPAATQTYDWEVPNHSSSSESSLMSSFTVYGVGGTGVFIYTYKWQESATSEYIYTTYGIRVEDSFGGDGYDQTAWSNHELSLLNDVLKQIPPDLLKNLALTSIVRNKTSLDENGNKEPDVFGCYSPCDQRVDPDCTGSSANIRIFDHAASPFDFTNDPNGDTQFKATILHEMIHALQSRRDQYSEYDNPTTSPLVENYMDATRPDTAIDAGVDRNGWAWYGKQLGWKLYGAPGNVPPTDYGKTNPLEDMSESAMTYVYDPQKLKDSSPQRYNFIRDQMFGGIEYENGIQKKP